MIDIDGNRIQKPPKFLAQPKVTSRVVYIYTSCTIFVHSAKSQKSRGQEHLAQKKKEKKKQLISHFGANMQK